MHKLGLMVALFATFAGAARAQGYHYTQGYTRSDGSYVAPHYQTNPDGNPYNNWSTRGNSNPFTGRMGDVDPDSSSGYFGSPHRSHSGW